jgi:hypothetical protein
MLSPASVRTMLRTDARTAQPARARKTSGDDGAEQGLAWQLRTLAGARVVGHEGEDDGASSALFLDLEAGTAAVVLANGDAFGSGDPARAAAIQSMLASLLVRAR